MSPPTPALRPATPADAARALAWTPDDEALRRWSGPSTRCPATAESLWEDISGSDTTTFAFVAPSGDMLGFGQVRFREQT